MDKKGGGGGKKKFLFPLLTRKKSLKEACFLPIEREREGEKEKNKSVQYLTCGKMGKEDKRFRWRTEEKSLFEIRTRD